jgi:two-component system, OmpR family, sensor kinase
MRDLRAASARVRREAERLPLKWRLALASFGLLAILLAALGGVVTFTQQRAMYQNQANALYQEAVVASRSQGGSNAYSLTSQLTSPSTRATIIGPDGSVIATDTNDAIEPAQVLPTASMIQRAFASPQTDAGYFIAVDRNGVRQLVELVQLSPAGPSQSPVALLVISTPTRAIDQAVAATRLTLGIGILIALALAGTLTFPLMSAALRPLVTMERASRRIAAGELSLRLEEPPTDDEIGRLARSFNSMVAQLEASFARQKQFVGDVSHELRTPLTALGGGLEMLLMGADRGDPVATRRLLRSQYAEVERMQRLVEDLLTLARLDEGQTVLRLETLDVAPLLNDVADEGERLTHGQQLNREIAADLPPVRVDGDRLRQVLLALLDNAVKYAPAPATLTLAAHRAPNGGLRLDVRDTGEGIPPEALPHVFERFYRVDPSRERSTVRGGSGLGLAIAKSLIEAQGGAISIASAPGGGTTVTIQFPPAPSAPAPSRQPTEQADGTPSPAAAGQHHP